MAKFSDDPKKVARELAKQLQLTAGDAKSILQALTDPWDHDVTWHTDGPALDGGDLVCRVWTSDAPFYFLDEGTGVRYAHMTRNFYPKTMPHSFRSGIGVGGLAFVSKRVRPRPGIEARKWTSDLAIQMLTPLQRRVTTVLAQYGAPAFNMAGSSQIREAGM